MMNLGAPASVITGILGVKLSGESARTCNSGGARLQPLPFKSGHLKRAGSTPARSLRPWGTRGRFNSC
jgi:hypothetical protein